MINNEQSTGYREPKSSYIEVNNVQLHLLDWGGAGDPILISHATGFLGRIYEPIARQLTRIGHVYSYDHRGQGDSPHKNGAIYNWDQTLLDLEAIITQMGWTNIRAIGHSAGATAIGSLAFHTPELISRAVLIDPVIFDISKNTFNEHPMRDRTLKRRRIFDSIDNMFDNFKSKPPFDTWDKDVLFNYCRFGTRALPNGRRELKCSPEIEATMYDTGRFFDGLGRILQTNTPLLFLFAGKLGPFSHYAKQIAQALDKAEVIVKPNLGHLMAMEAPREIADDCERFLTV